MTRAHSWRGRDRLKLFIIHLNPWHVRSESFIYQELCSANYEITFRTVFVDKSEMFDKLKLFFFFFFYSYYSSVDGGIEANASAARLIITQSFHCFLQRL